MSPQCRSESYLQFLCKYLGPYMQGKSDIHSSSEKKPYVPTVQMRELSMKFHIRIWFHRAGERNMHVRPRTQTFLWGVSNRSNFGTFYDYAWIILAIALNLAILGGGGWSSDPPDPPLVTGLHVSLQEKYMSPQCR